VATEHVSETLFLGPSLERVINLAYNDRGSLVGFVCVGGYCHYCEIGETVCMGVHEVKLAQVTVQCRVTVGENFRPSLRHASSQEFAYTMELIWTLKEQWLLH
jgi:hypothetical protein